MMSMRTFLSGLLITVFAISTSVALGAHIAANTLLNPGRSTDLASDVGGQIAGQLMASLPVEELTPALSVDPELQAELRSVLDTDPQAQQQVKRALTEMTSYDAGAARDKVAGALARSGHPALARKLRSTNTGELPDRQDVNDLLPNFDIPGQDKTSVLGLFDAAGATIARWRTGAEQLAGKAALLAALCMSAGVIVARSRRAVLKGAANTVVFATGGTLLLFAGLPRLLEEFSEAAWWRTLTQGLIANGSEITGPLVPLFVAAVVVRVASSVVPVGALGALLPGIKPGKSRAASEDARADQPSPTPLGGFGGSQVGGATSRGGRDAADLDPRLAHEYSAPLAEPSWSERADWEDTVVVMPRVPGEDSGQRG